VAADQEGEESEQVEYEDDHEPRLWPERADRSLTWLADDVLARGQGSAAALVEAPRLREEAGVNVVQEEPRADSAFRACAAPDRFGGARLAPTTSGRSPKRVHIG
jgi:hypothetical protein